MQVQAVVIEGEARHWRGIPPAQVVLFPGVVEQRRLEVTPVAHQIAADGSDAPCAQLNGKLPERPERVRLAGSCPRRIAGEAAAAHGGIAPPVEHQVSSYGAALNRTRRIDARVDCRVRGDHRRGEGADEELGVAGRDEEAGGISPIELFARRVEHHHTPVVAVKRGCVEQAVKPLGQRLSAEGGHHAGQAQQHRGGTDHVKLGWRWRNTMKDK